MASPTGSSTSLANLGSPQAIPAIFRLLEDNNPQVRQLTRVAIKVLRKTEQQDASFAMRSANNLQNTTALIWPAWVRRIENYFALVSAIFTFFFTIQFLTDNWGVPDVLSQVIADISFISLSLGIILFVLVIAGVFQVRIRFHDLITLIKHRPWRRSWNLVSS